MKKKNHKDQWIEVYEKEYRRQTEAYEQWIAKWEGEIPVQRIEDVCFAVQPWEDIFSSRVEPDPVEALSLFLRELAGNVQYVILTGAEGRIAEQAKYYLREYFEMHPEAEAVYGDEDEWNKEDQKRQNPWFKPDWSPDTLHSCLYIGNMIAMRVSLLKKAAEKLRETAGYLPERRKEDISQTVLEELGEGYGKYSDFWRFLLWLTDVMGVSFGHVDRILYHRYVTGQMKERQESQEQGMEQSSGIVRETTCSDFEAVHVRYPMAGGEKLVSVIIPSKDHPELLKQCLNAIHGVTAYPSYEVIVVDNGSTPENQSLIRSMQEQMHFTYLYEEMEFNFSKMCNLGAAHAKGDVLLFLNDDIEAQGKEWMTILTEQALQPHTGAVGAKLYYPDSKIIQHTGVTNMKIGPAHKLGGMEDQGSLYHGRNLADHNVLAVTAACMAVERKKYDEVGGFCEELAVAYNDVDICFSLYEKGYYNLVRNDVVLFHHESYSRGSDRVAAKEKRLLQERKKLYQRHPELYGKDPFYSRHLVQERLDADYHVEMQYEHEQSDRFSFRQPIDCLGETKNGLFRKLARKGSWNQYHLDEARIRQTDLFEEDSMVLELEGWCALTDRDMAEYERALMLIGQDGMAEQLEIFDKLRPDAAEILSEQPHGALCGFVVRIRVQDIQDGEYQVGYLFCPRSGGRPLVQYGERLILGSTPELQSRTASIVRKKE
ncbi:MAG: glycosyltransferase [Lachnospiraceae bacterium]|nr:glycosyltransferase [Lachnospiraceae bacterium]